MIARTRKESIMNKTKQPPRARITLARTTVRTLTPELLGGVVAAKMNPTHSCEPDCPHPID
jgi:hypothetical protein